MKLTVTFLRAMFAAISASLACFPQHLSPAVFFAAGFFNTTFVTIDSLLILSSSDDGRLFWHRLQTDLAAKFWFLQDWHVQLEVESRGDDAVVESLGFGGIEDDVPGSANTERSCFEGEIDEVPIDALVKSRDFVGIISVFLSIGSVLKSRLH